MNVNQAAFYTISTLALTTAGLTTGAILAQATVTTVALAALTALSSALSIAAISAWATLKGRVGEYSSERGEIIEDESKEYFNKLFSYLGYAVVAIAQTLSQGIVFAAFAGVSQGITMGISSGISQNISRSIYRK